MKSEFTRQLLAALLLGGCVAMMLRSILVYRYRSRLRNIVMTKEREDIEAGKEKGRYDEFRKVEYKEMVRQFWRPLKSFYDEQKLLH